MFSKYIFLPSVAGKEFLTDSDL